MRYLLQSYTQLLLQIFARFVRICYYKSNRLTAPTTAGGGSLPAIFFLRGLNPCGCFVRFVQREQALYSFCSMKQKIAQIYKRLIFSDFLFLEYNFCTIVLNLRKLSISEIFFCFYMQPMYGGWCCLLSLPTFRGAGIFVVFRKKSRKFLKV